MPSQWTKSYVDLSTLLAVQVEIGWKYSWQNRKPLGNKKVSIWRPETDRSNGWRWKGDESMNRWNRFEPTVTLLAQNCSLLSSLGKAYIQIVLFISPHNVFLSLPLSYGHKSSCSFLQLGLWVLSLFLSNKGLSVLFVPPNYILIAILARH